MRAVLAVALVVLAAGCSSGEPTASVTSSSSTTTTTRAIPTTTTAKRVPGALADEWDKKFQAARGSNTTAPCSPAQVRTAACADYLTTQVEVVSALYAALRIRDDSSRFNKTIVATEKVFNASETYSKLGCNVGRGTVDDCWTQAFIIGTSVVNVGVVLRIDDLTL